MKVSNIFRNGKMVCSMQTVPPTKLTKHIKTIVKARIVLLLLSNRRVINDVVLKSIFSFAFQFAPIVFPQIVKIELLARII